LNKPWQGRTITVMLRHTQAGDTARRSPDNADFAVIWMHVSREFQRTREHRTHYAVLRRETSHARRGI
jgi:hypothetical protein